MSGNARIQAVAVAGCTGLLAVVLAGTAGSAAANDPHGAVLTVNNSSGVMRTVNVNGAFDFDNPFFQDLGTNGRRCVTCHQPDSAWTVSAANIEERFARTRGTDAIFTNHDGSNCEGANPRTLAERRAAYSLLLTRGLIRIGLDIPAGAEFTIDSVEDPLGCGPATNDASLYRRPLPTTNLNFLSTVMWDGRESTAGGVVEALMHQANTATRNHAQAAADLTPEQARQIVDFETGLFTAQARDREAGNLQAERAAGGPAALSRQLFFIGINDPVGLNPTGAAFDRNVFTLFDAWATLNGSHVNPMVEARRAIARGARIFNTKPITISGVAGLNGETFGSGVTVPSSFSGTCTVCHDAPNAGSHSVAAPLDVGVADPSRAPYLPVYTLRNFATNATVRTTDPGRAMITGKWKDVGKFKGPILRALAARAPYFHNGSAATLEGVVEFYESRFGIDLTAREKADLVAFLRAL